jgi:hypothetical protein
MPVEDGRAAAASQSAIAASAAIYGYILDSSYSHRQIACPVAPHHLLLAYQAVQPGGGISRFTAVIARDASQSRTHAQIIPIAHFGVTPFVPAEKNAHTLEVFNGAVTAAPTSRTLAIGLEEGSDPLLVRGLCYLAMIGVAPEALRIPTLNAATMQAPVPTVAFLEKGLAREVFSSQDSDSGYQVWTLTFSRKGELVKAEHEQRRGEARVPEVATASSAVPAAPPTPALPPPAPSSAAASAPTRPVIPTTSASVGVAPASAGVLPVSASPATPNSGSLAAVLDPAAMASANSAAKVARPQPTGRVIRNLPPPPSRFIPDAAMPSPPQAPER